MAHAGSHLLSPERELAHELMATFDEDGCFEPDYPNGQFTNPVRHVVTD